MDDDYNAKSRAAGFFAGLGLVGAYQTCNAHEGADNQ